MHRSLALDVAVFLFAGCSSEPEPPPNDVPENWQTCTNVEVGYTAIYPSEWETNHGVILPACTLFDPDPIAIDPDTHIPFDIAIAFRHEPIPFETIVDLGPFERAIEHDTLTVAGRPAARMLVEQTEDMLRPAGSVTYQYVIDLNGRSLVAAAYDTGPLGFDQKRRILDQMMDGLRFELDEE